MSDASQDPQADQDEARFKRYMAERHGIGPDVVDRLAPEQPSPSPSPPPASAAPSLPDLHPGPRASPSMGDYDEAVRRYLERYFPGRPAA